MKKIEVNHDDKIFGDQPASLWNKIYDELVKQAIRFLSYEASIGILGKTGSGKSTLVNALFGSNVRETSTYKGCSRDVGTVTLEIDGKKLHLYDLPGAGESIERDREYSQLYKEILPKLDVVLWVIKADDRALTSDEVFYKEIILPYINESKTPILFVISNADKMEPSCYSKWDTSHNPPTLISIGDEQKANLANKINDVSRIFHVSEEIVIPVSSTGNFNLKNLLLKIVQSVPPEKKAAIYDRTEKSVRSEEAAKDASDGVISVLVGTIISILPVIAPNFTDDLKEAIEKAARLVWNKVSGWFD